MKSKIAQQKMERNDRSFVKTFVWLCGVAAIFTVAILANLVFELGLGWNVSDLKGVAVIWLILGSIFAVSRVFKAILNTL